MHSSLEDVVLRDGARARCVVIEGPDESWRERVEHTHAHKGPIWRRQVHAMIARPSGAQAFFYQLHQDAEDEAANAPALANIMTIESGGVGIVGHVFTRPEHRGRHAATLLMGRLLSHFRARGGRALYLSTGFGSSAFRIYESNGFRAIEPQSGVMSFFSGSESAFEDEYFAPGPIQIAPLDWPAWATAPALFTGGFPGLVRGISLGLLGRCLSEEALLGPVEEEERRAHEGRPPRTQILRKENGAVVGLSSWGAHPLWPQACVVDAYCHPNFWHHAPDLLSGCESANGPLVAYADAGHEEKARALQAVGFEKRATLPGWVAESVAGQSRRAVEVWSRG